MMKVIMRFLFFMFVILISGCNSYHLVSVDILDKYMAESASSSFHVWSLEYEDQSFYYLKRKTGVISFDYFKISKKNIVFDVRGDPPILFKFKDIKKINKNNQGQTTVF